MYQLKLLGVAGEGVRKGLKKKRELGKKNYRQIKFKLKKGE